MNGDCLKPSIGISYTAAGIMYGLGFYFLAKDAEEPEYVKIILSIVFGALWLPIWLITVIIKHNNSLKEISNERS